MQTQKRRSTGKLEDAPADTTNSEASVLVSVADVPSHELADLLENNRVRCSCRRQPCRRIKSKGVGLLLLVNCFVDVSFNGALGSVLSSLLTQLLHLEHSGVKVFLLTLFVRSLPQVGYPVAGYLADVHFGRYRVIISGLWLMVVGYSLISVTFLIKAFYHTDWGLYITYLVVFPIAFFTINSGQAAFQANIIPFGLDQLPDGSTQELSAFVHWYYGTRNIAAGIVPLLPCFVTIDDLKTAVHSLANLVLIFAAVLLVLFLKEWLIIEYKERENPFRTVYNILKFASKHKAPLSRSSFTYWEDELPSRIDLAKEKYGGPFSTEKVENVKTFLRIGVVFVSLLGFVVGYYVTSVSTQS